MMVRETAGEGVSLGSAAAGFSIEARVVGALYRVVVWALVAGFWDAAVVSAVLRAAVAVVTGFADSVAVSVVLCGPPFGPCLRWLMV